MGRTLKIAAITAALIMGGCASEPAPGDTVGASRAVEDAGPVRVAATGDTVEVWKDPNCGCCKDWIEHMEENGFVVIARDTRDMTPVKRQHDVAPDLVSCHTGSVGGYAIEGHVPADLIRKMLDEKPGIRGLAVPGMPIGSPGMEGAIKQDYDVIAFTADGGRTVYAKR